MANLQASTLFSVNGLVAVVTGGGSGLGRSMTLALDANGASKVFIVGRREDKLRETAALATRGSVIPIAGDVTSKESLQAVYDQIALQTDHIDLLVANSGIMGPQPGFPPGKLTLAELQKNLSERPMEDFSQVFRVNVTGAFYTAVVLLPLLDAANTKRAPVVPGVLSPARPQIVIMSSVAGYARDASVGGVGYNSSKAAVNALIKMLSTTLAPYHIRVNGIAPGPYYSEMTAGTFGKLGLLGQGLSEGSIPAGFIPLTRSGGEEDIAGIILWLAGAAGGYVNGNIVITDGGRVAVTPSTY
ncbi:3-oxoacyl-reductase [Diplogelasinospora grovesii]|uniref:3-oxoacyl-reductase n=1 Tax=Diplogelasinospora grovesii TaxID=303347 RepID=A0AAN6NCM3_9PEZI|nr:3-oxoacyl-reductase [Diplogelasinospora grovesii]